MNIDNDTVLDQLENVLKGYHSPTFLKLTIYDFAERLTKEEVEEFERVIRETTDTIDPDDWK